MSFSVNPIYEVIDSGLICTYGNRSISKTNSGYCGVFCKVAQDGWVGPTIISDNRAYVETNIYGAISTFEIDGITLYVNAVAGLRHATYSYTITPIVNYPGPGGSGDTYDFVEWLISNDYIRVAGGPYEPGGTSGPGGGDGTFDFSSQPVDFQSAPSIGAYDTGMVSMYVPSAANLRDLASYLWAGPFDPQNFRKLLADPMDAVIGLSILPLTAAEIGTQSAELMVGNVSTGLTMPLATRQYVVVDCGTVNVLPKWGAYLDFSPYSKLQLFLPYIGYVDISPDDCMNGTISVRYTVDLLSGTCVVQVKCQDHVLYEFAGTCSCSCPVTAGQYQNVVTSALKLGGALMSSVTSLGGMLGALDDVANTAVSAAKPAISRSGGFGGSSGLMGHQVPYLILTVPRMCTPGDQNVMMGYPSFVTEVLGDLSGYCVVDTIHLSGIPGASTADLEEIDQLLKGGVYL